MVLKGRVVGVFFERVASGADLLKSLKEISEKLDVKSGVFIAIGALSKVRVGVYDGKGGYSPVEREGFHEMISCTGNISRTEDGEIFVHSHVLAVSREGEVVGGHLLEGSIVDITTELVIFEADAKLIRALDSATGYRLWRT